MRLPFLQVDGDFLAHKARPVAFLLGCSKAAAVGHLSLLWAWAVSQGPEDAAPTGIVTSGRAAVVVAAAAEWDGDPAAFVTALADGSVGLLDVLPDGLRIRGLDRYAAAWDRQRKERARKADYRKKSASPPAPVPPVSRGTSVGHDADGVGQIKTQIKTHRDDPPKAPQGAREPREGDPCEEHQPPAIRGPAVAKLVEVISPPSVPGPADWSIRDAVLRVYAVVADGRVYPWDKADEKAQEALGALCHAEGIPPARWPEEVGRRFGRALVRQRDKFATGKATTLQLLAVKACWLINAEVPTRTVEGRNRLTGKPEQETRTVEPWIDVLHDAAKEAA